jgi:surface polysaccharide O-acyltransferase-like enzyme
LQRFFYLDVLRILSAFAVVVLHVAVTGWSYFGVDTFEWQILNVFNGLSRWCVPIFVMISGALFLDPKRSITIRDIYRKYILRVAMIIGVWALTLIFLKLIKGLYYHGVTLENVMRAFQNMEYPPGVSWFLFMLLGLYAFAPILKHVAHDKNTLLYIMCVSLVLNTLITYSGLLAHGEWMLVQIKLFGLEYFLGFIGFFCAGAYFKLYFNSSRVRTVLYCLGSIGMAVTVVGTSLLSLSHHRAMAQFYGFLSPNVTFTAYALFCLFAQFNLKEPSEKVRRVVVETSKATLLVYVLHCYVIVGLRTVGVSVIKLPVILAPLIALLTFIVSLGLARVLLRSRWISKIFA